LSQEDVRGAEGTAIGIISQSDWGSIRISPENGKKIPRTRDIDAPSGRKNECYSVRPFNHKGMNYFWIRIEDG
jgi:hypothetical protein